MPMTNDIDELNIVKMVRGDSYNRYYEYFSKMSLEEEEIEDRVQMAMSFEDSLLPVLILALLLFQNGTYNRRDMRNRLASAYVNAVEDEGYLDDYTEDRAETFAKEVEGTTYEALKKAKEKAEAEKKSTMPIVPGVPTKTDGGSTSGVSIVGGEEDPATSMDRVERMSRTEAAIVLNHSEFETAKENGMTRKTWVTRKDKRVRESHDHMEGMTIPIDAPFILSGVEMMFPCDTTNDPPAKEVVNCRCSLKFSGIIRSALNPRGFERTYSDGSLPFSNHVKEGLFRRKTGNESSREYVEIKRLQNAVEKDFDPLPERKVADVLRKIFHAWVEKLTPAERKSIEQYTLNYGDKSPNKLFERMNAMLRGDRPNDPVVMKHAENISAALLRAVITKDIVVYRGLDIDVTLGKSLFEPFSMKQFTSTSVMENRAFDGTYLYEIHIRQGTRGVAYIGEVSHLPKQLEVLIDKSTLFRVISRQGRRIVLEVIKQ